MGWKDKFDIEQTGKCHYKQIWRYFKNKIQANVMKYMGNIRHKSL